MRWNFFAVSLVVTNTERKPTVYHTALVHYNVEPITTEEIRQLMVAKGVEMYPPSDGWCNADIAVVGFDPEAMAKMAKQ